MSGRRMETGIPVIYSSGGLYTAALTAASLSVTSLGRRQVGLELPLARRRLALRQPCGGVRKLALRPWSLCTLCTLTFTLKIWWSNHPAWNEPLTFKTHMTRSCGFSAYGKLCAVVGESCGRPLNLFGLPAAESSIRVSRISAVTASDRVAHVDTS